MRSIHIISLGKELLLLRLREAVLQQLGYSVKSVSDLPTFATHVLGGDYNLALLCHTLTANTVNEVVSFARETKPSMMLIGLSPLSEEARRICDGVCYSDVLALQECIEQVMAKTARLPAPPPRFEPTSQQLAPSTVRRRKTAP